MGALSAAVVAALLVTQPFGGGGTAAEGPPPTQLEAKAERLAERAAEEPGDAGATRAALVAWIDAGNDRVDQSRFDEAEPDFSTAVRDYRRGLGLWPGFLRLTGGEASADLAEGAGDTYFRLTEIGTRDLARLEADLAAGLAAMRIAGGHNHTLYTLSHQAIFSYFNGEFDGGEATAETAKADVEPDVLDAVENQFVEYRERAEVFRGQLRRARQELRRSGEDLLARPLKVFRSNAELNDDDPTVSASNPPPSRG